MKLFLSLIFALAAIASLAFAVYTAIPIFPYIKDPTVALSFVVFLIFYYLAYRTYNGRKKVVN
ncbi:hypothetical protein [Mucilaginibacter sp. dw_454]|uniref:hypothetical protein n=1 Tax=Mucilaginibacter sp. dw_454 TaxID=2720079 RepID=UPI001BD4FAA0|nr:hypothetical protein [Mucilaginibacter sp. dw_454]